MADAVTLPAIMQRENIARVRWWNALGKWSVVLTDGRLGIGATEDEALANAMLPGAENIAT